MASAQAAFFDLDGTLITGHMYSHIIKRRVSSPLGVWRTVSYMLGHLAMVPLVKARLAGPFVFGEGKARQAQEYLSATGLELDLAASYAYADRIHDLPLLQLVGHPVATYPDVELLAHARQQGWRVVGEAHA